MHWDIEWLAAPIAIAVLALFAVLSRGRTPPPDG